MRRPSAFGARPREGRAWRTLRRMAPLLLLAAAAAIPAQAGQLFSRNEVEFLLNGKGVLDDFETFSIPDDTSFALGVSQLDDQTVVQGQGPGLVNPGCRYSAINAPLCWMGAFYAGYPLTRTLVAWYPPAALAPESPQLFRGIYIIYDAPVQVTGIDLLRFTDDNVGLITVEVYDKDGTQLEDVSVDIVDRGSPAFFGYRHDYGLGYLVIKNTKFGGDPTSPNVNDHIYGNVDTTPVEPSSWGRLKALYR